MNNSDPRRLLVSATPLLALIALLVLFYVPAIRYVDCYRTNCASIVANVNRVVAASHESVRKALETDQRVGSIYVARINFLFLLVVYFGICVLAFVVGCLGILKSLSYANVKSSTTWCIAAIALSSAVGVFLYRKPGLYLSLFLPLIRSTIQVDLSATESLLVFVNSFGFATVLLLTLASCAALYPRNKRTSPEGLKQITLQMTRLRSVLYVGTFMLVSGILLIRSVYHWVLAFDLRDEKVVQTAGSFFAALLTAQGGFFTLVLAVVYLPAALILRKRADSLSGLPELEKDKEELLHNYNLSFSFMQSLPRIAAILGPLLAGPVGELFSRLG
ncbi:MAG TPA: hypothetical protein VFY34_07965 [Pyrinomonadaceae bacterium]|nr:hypothetical protein [Pyrinomonadaceae bacterium]